MMQRVDAGAVAYDAWEPSERTFLSSLPPAPGSLATTSLAVIPTATEPKRADRCIRGDRDVATECCHPDKEVQMVSRLSALCSILLIAALAGTDPGQLRAKEPPLLPAA